MLTQKIISTKNGSTYSQALLPTYFLLIASCLVGCNVGKTDDVLASDGGTGGCKGSYIGEIVAPPENVRTANRDRQLAEGGALRDAVDGGIFLEGTFAWETDINCVVTSGTATINGDVFQVTGKVNSNRTFALNASGLVEGAISSGNDLTGQFRESGREWVYGDISGKFLANGKL